MKAIFCSILVIFLISCTSSNTDVSAEGLTVQLEDILVTLDPEKQIISAKIGNEKTYPIVDFSEYNTMEDADFTSSISKSDDSEGVVLDCSNGKTKQQLLIKKSHIIGLCAPAFFGGEINVATPQEIEEMNQIPPVKFYKDSMNGEEVIFE